MNEYVKIPLSRLIDNIGEEKAMAILSDFSCPVNSDIEYFLRTRAIEFEKQGLSATHLVFLSQESQTESLTETNQILTVNILFRCFAI